MKKDRPKSFGGGNDGHDIEKGKQAKVPATSLGSGDGSETGIVQDILEEKTNTKLQDTKAEPLSSTVEKKHAAFGAKRGNNADEDLEEIPLAPAELAPQPGAVRVQGPGGRQLSTDSFGTIVVGGNSSRPPMTPKEKSEYLINATLVDEETSSTEVSFAEARIVKDRPWRRRLRIACLVIVVVTITVGLVVPLTNRRNRKNTNESTSFPTSAPTSQPSMTPTTTPAPTALGITTVVLQLDDKPEETGWKLDCGGENIANFPAGVYQGRANRLVTEQFPVLVGEECMFTISDSGGDGLDGGFFRMHFGQVYASDGTLLIEGTGDFTDKIDVGFAMIAPPTNSPTGIPTQAPSTTSQPSYTPSVTPSASFEPSLSPTTVPSLSPTPSPTVPPLAPTLPPVLPPTVIIPPTLLPPTNCDTPGAGCNQGSEEPIFPAPGPTPGIVQPPPPTSPPTRLPTPAPTMFPTMTPTVARTEVQILVEIQTDEFPSETGWNMACDGSVVASVEPLTYGQPNQRISTVVSTRNGASCTFTIVDTFGDGICCRFEPRGSYRLFYFDETTSTNDNIIAAGGEFGMVEKVDFIVREPL